MSHTPSDPHFIRSTDIDTFSHRHPSMAAMLLVKAISATALFRVWPTLLLMGGWSTAIVLINKKTSAELTVPATMLTVLGVLLGLTLSYRTSSAYDRYWEGRRLWSQIILASRTWSRMVWLHCPDTLVAEAPAAADEESDDAKREREAAALLDESRAIIEKKTMVQMALAFAVAVKHYLRGEEGIYYEDMYDLVRFIPSLHLPSGIPSPQDANIASGHAHTRHVLRQSSVETDNGSESASEKRSNRPHLRPAREPPKFRFSETFPFCYLVSEHQRSKAKGRKAQRKRMKQERSGGGAGHNVPLELSLFMSCWISTMQTRKTIDVATINGLLNSVNQMTDALASLERILTTPIPWSYNCHIWEITWIYCLLLPFQLYGAGFNWVTVPATVVTAYIVVGFAEIGAEIENPFGYDPNDLNLDFFTENIIRQELEAVTTRPFPDPSEWIFSANNTFATGGDREKEVSADDLQHMGAKKIREVFKERDSVRFRGRAQSPVEV